MDVSFKVCWCPCNVLSMFSPVDDKWIPNDKSNNKRLRHSIIWPKRPENNSGPFRTGKYSETFSLGHLYSRDKKFGPRKMRT